MGRHFKDIDDLRLNRDGSLDYSENLDFEAEKIADEILEKTLENDKNIISFVISPKKRTLETTELIIKKIKEKNTKIKCLVKEQESIRELDQGEYILNSDYENGNVVGELSLANDIYWQEVSEKRNFDYHFGDPIQTSEGFTYPDFANFFVNYGESYKEQSIRPYESVIDLYEKKENLERVNLVVITHGGPLVVFNELSVIADKIIISGWKPEIGSIMNLTWDNYINTGKDIAKDHRSMENISINGIFNEEVMDILKDEIKYMKDSLGTKKKNEN